ncbi:hypothetical protein ACFYY8_24095 [Streptosporangium sp. NPDC001559]|uniref:hypothetical protein n=1 Tax=Streptosporangium sp. NPDC001559 TaxID=3366187 RepID=UPI0036ECBB86
MNNKTKFAFAVAVGTLALSVFATPSNASSAGAGLQMSSTNKAACQVQHHFYDVGNARRVDLSNECSSTRYVCIDKVWNRDSGPHAVPGRSTKTVSYATWPEPTGRSVYYASSSSSC